MSLVNRVDELLTLLETFNVSESLKSETLVESKVAESSSASDELLERTKQPIHPVVYDDSFIRTGKLSNLQLAFYRQHGFIGFRWQDVYTREERDNILRWSLEVSEWPETSEKTWMHYYNMQKKSDGTNSGKRILSRVENIFAYHKELRREYEENGKIMQIASQLIGEPLLMYKEKLNFKYPGDDGFEAHQDHAAGWWSHGHTFHINGLQAVDDTTIENGCLETVSNWGSENKDLVSERFKGVSKYCEDNFQWYYHPQKAGDLFFFTSFVPHRSKVNLTNHPRRVIIATWNKKTEGDAHAQYFIDKRKSFPPDIERNKGEKYEYKI